MNPAQQALYFREWGTCRKALAALGRPHDDAARKAIQVQALAGTVKSSKSLTNAELTRVLARFRSWSQPGNLTAQLHAEDDGDRRVAELRARILRLAAVCGIQRGAEGIEVYFRAWLRGRPFAALSERELQQLVGLLERRVRQLQPEPAAEDDGNPF